MRDQKHGGIHGPGTPKFPKTRCVCAFQSLFFKSTSIVQSLKLHLGNKKIAIKDFREEASVTHTPLLCTDRGAPCGASEH